MKLLQLLPIGNLEDGLLQRLETAISQCFHVPCEVIQTDLEPALAFQEERQQYQSSALIRDMQNFAGPRYWRLLGVTEVDLYIPILTFVFGAQVSGPGAVVPLHRLRQEFYG
jgi:archaemetzincin